MRARRTRSKRLTRLFAAAFAVVLASSAGSAALRLLWCPGMQEARIACCCPEVDHERDVLRAPCCEAQATFAHDAVHAQDGTPRVLAASAAPLVAQLDARAGEPLVQRARHELRARAGPSERLHARHSIYLV